MKRQSVLLNDGGGNFALAPTQPPVDLLTSTNVALGELDGDGDLDAFVTNRDGPNEALLNDGNGAFSPALTEPEGVGTGYEAWHWATSMGMGTSTLS